MDAAEYMAVWNTGKRQKTQPQCMMEQQTVNHRGCGECVEVVCWRVT